MRRRMNVLLICTCNLSSSNKITTPARRKHAHMTDNLPKQAALTAQTAAPARWWGHFWEKQMTAVCVCVCWRADILFKNHASTLKNNCFPTWPIFPPTVWLCKSVSERQFDNIIPGIKSMSPVSLWRRDRWMVKKKKRDKEPRDNREFTEASIQSTKQKMIHSVWFQSADISWFDFI